MKFKLLFSVLMFAFSNSLCGQIPNWVWVKKGGGISIDIANAIATDGQGNSFVTGNFKSNIIHFDADSLLNNGNQNAFLVKYNAAGDVIWSFSPGGWGMNVYAYGVCVDTYGNVIIAGKYKNFNITFDTLTFSNQGGYDLFITKLDSSGTVLWAKTFGGNQDDEATRIAVDYLGNSYVIGDFTSTTLVLGNDTLVNSSSGSSFNTSDAFIAKFDSYGNEIWARGLQGAFDEWAASVCTDKCGSVIFTGVSVSSTLSFGNDTLTDSTWNGKNFIFKLTTSGSLIWKKWVSGSNIIPLPVRYCNVCTDNSCNIFWQGRYSFPLKFDTINLPAGGNENFLVKFDQNGNVLWAINPNPGSIEWINNMAVKNDGSLIIAGCMYDLFSSFGPFTLTNTGTTNPFAVEYNPAGAVLWAINAGGTKASSATGVSIDGYGNILITGIFNDSICSFGGTNITTSGQSDSFIALLGHPSVVSNSVPQPQNLNIFPNPANGNFTILSEKPLGHVFIRNAFGQLIYQTNTNQNEINLNISTQGVYFVNISNGNFKTSKKLVITH